MWMMSIKRVFRMLAGVLRFMSICILACGLTILVFLLLPMMQGIAKAPKNDVEVRTVDSGSLEAPPPPPEEPPQEEEEEPPPPEMTEEAQPLDLSQLEMALNPGMGGGGEGDFEVKLFTSMEKKVEDEADAIFSMADLDQVPKAIYQTAPEYPPELKRKNINGTVHILFIVDQMGRVKNPMIQKSTNGAFEQPALRAIRNWKFQPGKRNGQPVQFKMKIPITFMQ